MEITIEQLYKGKSTKINDKDFLATKSYTEGFINKMKLMTSNFRIEVIPPKQMTITSNETDITYNKVLIQAILPKQVGDYNEVIALTYSLDTRTPLYKIYRAYYNNTTGTTMCFNSDWLVVRELKPLQGVNIAAIDTLMSLPDDTELRVKNMKSKVLSTKDSERTKRIGEYIEKCFFATWKNSVGGKISISPLNLVKVYQSVYIDQNSDFYVGDKDSTIMNMFEAMTQFIASDKKDIGNKVEKTFLINQLMGL
jgi:hypothetical protein